MHSLQVRLTQWNPVPDSATVVWLAPLVTVRLPPREPPCVGVNVTLIVQVAKPASEAGQLFVCPKSPLVAMPEIGTADPELFVKTTGLGDVVSVICVPVNVRLPGFAVSAGTTVSIPITDVVPVVAVTVTGVAVLTDPAVTEKVFEFVATATVTDPGTGATGGSPLVRPTFVPPVGAVPFSVAVPVVICPNATLLGLNASVAMTGGSTVTPPPLAEPLGSVAVTVTGVLAATGDDVTLNVPLVAAPAMLKFAGTVSAAVLLLISVTVSPAAGAGPFSVTLPCEALPPVTELGVNVNDEIVAGLTAKFPDALLVPSVANTCAFTGAATPVVVAVNVCVLRFASTVTNPGTVTDGSPLLSETIRPPAGAFWLSVTVPVELVPPVTPEGLKVTDCTVRAGNIVTLPVTVVVLVIAVTATFVEVVTDPAVAEKVWLVLFAATVTFAGTGRAVVLPLCSVTCSPPAGAGPVSVTVPVVTWPMTALVGINDRLTTTGATTVIGTVDDAPLGKVAVMLTFAPALTANVVTLNVPLLAPPAMLKLAGTVAALVLLLISVTVNPDGGAGPLKTRVPTDPVPPVTNVGLSVSDIRAAGLTVSVAVMKLVPSAALTETFLVVATPVVVAVKV